MVGRFVLLCRVNCSFAVSADLAEKRLFEALTVFGLLSGQS